MKIILAPIELLGMIIKPFSLMIRLYANIFAGHIVLMSIIGLMFIFKVSDDINKLFISILQKKNNK